MLNNGNDEIDFPTMKKLLTKLNISKFCFLKHDEDEAIRLWRSLLSHQMDTSISFSKLQALLTSPVKEHSKSSNRSSGSRPPLKLVNQVPISFSKFTKSSPNNFDRACTPLGQNKLKKSISKSRIDQLIKEKQDHYKKLIEINKIKENKLLEECSFRPKTNINKNAGFNTSKPGIKNIQLYEKGKQRLKSRGRDKSKDEIQYEQNKHEYTFNPTIGARTNVSTQKCKGQLVPLKNREKKAMLITNKPSNQQPNVAPQDLHKTYKPTDLDLSSVVSNANTKQLSDTYSGFKQSSSKDFIYSNKADSEQGKIKLPVSSQQNKAFRHDEEDQLDITNEAESNATSDDDSETPILFLDVNFGNGDITRIVMYENDKPEELAEAFCIENGLDMSKKDKLVKIIYQQLETVLEKIEEESEDHNLTANL